MPYEELSLQNPDQTLDDSALQLLSHHHHLESELRDFEQQADLPDDVTKDLNEARRDTYSNVARAIGLDFERLDEMSRTKNELVTERLKERIRFSREKRIMSVLDQKLLHPIPEPLDPSFWWAQTSAFTTKNQEAAFVDSGLRFTGGPILHTWNGEGHYDFGATADFALQAARIPESPSGRWLSTPTIDILGGVLGHAPDESWPKIQGDGIAELRIELRHRLFQIGFAGGRIDLAGGTSDAAGFRFYLKNADTHRGSMPGFTLMPALVITNAQLNSTLTVFAELKVNFHIYLKTAGALLWCDPEVLVRTIQWPLVPLAG